MRIMSIAFLLFSLFTIRAQHPNPDIYAELIHNNHPDNSVGYFPKYGYELKNGEPLEVTIRDTVFLEDNTFQSTIDVFTPIENNGIMVKRYRGSKLTANEVFQRDINNRVVLNADSISTGSTKSNTDGVWSESVYLNRILFRYKENKKIAERIDGKDNVISRFIVHYDSLRNPILLTETHMSVTPITRVETVDYDYGLGQFTHTKHSFQNDVPEIKKGYLIVDCTIDKNEAGDVTKMFWPLSKQTDSVIHKIDYTYDEFGNWISRFITLQKPDKPKKVISKIYRNIKYKEIEKDK